MVYGERDAMPDDQRRVLLRAGAARRKDEFLSKQLFGGRRVEAGRAGKGLTSARDGPSRVPARKRDRRHESSRRRLKTEAEEVKRVFWIKKAPISSLARRFGLMSGGCEDCVFGKGGQEDQPCPHRMVGGRDGPRPSASSCASMKLMASLLPWARANHLWS